MIEFGLKLSSQMYRVAFFWLNLWVMPGSKILIGIWFGGKHDEI